MVFKLMSAFGMALSAFGFEGNRELRWFVVAADGWWIIRDYDVGLRNVDAQVFWDISGTRGIILQVSWLTIGMFRSRYLELLSRIGTRSGSTVHCGYVRVQLISNSLPMFEFRCGTTTLWHLWNNEAKLPWKSLWINGQKICETTIQSSCRLTGRRLLCKWIAGLST